MARRLVAADQNVAIIERKFFGGTCVATSHLEVSHRRGLSKP